MSQDTIQLDLIYTIFYVLEAPSISFPPYSPPYIGQYDSPPASTFGQYAYLFLALKRPCDLSWHGPRYAFQIRN